VDAICASSPARAAAVAERLSIPRAQGDWRAMVQDPELDALALSVPPQLQAEIALATVHVGKHLFAEKPWHVHRGGEGHRRYGEGNRIGRSGRFPVSDVTCLAEST